MITPPQKEIRDATRWMQLMVDAKREKFSSWANYRHNVWYHINKCGENTLTTSAFPPFDWHVPAAYLIAYLRIKNRMSIDTAIKHLKKTGRIDQ